MSGLESNALKHILAVIKEMNKQAAKAQQRMEESQRA